MKKTCYNIKYKNLNKIFYKSFYKIFYLMESEKINPFPSDGKKMN